MSTKRICDMCGGDIGTPFYQFEALMKEYSGNGAAGQVVNISKPVADLCKDCSEKVIPVLNDIPLPTIASTQT